MDKSFFEDTGSSPSPLICIAVWKVPISLPFPQFSSTSLIKKYLFCGSYVTFILSCSWYWCFRLSHVHLTFTFPREEGKPFSLFRSVYTNSIEMIYNLLSSICAWPRGEFKRISTLLTIWLMKISFTKTFYSSPFLPENMKLILSLGRKEGFYLKAFFFPSAKVIFHWKASISLLSQ